MRSLLTSLVLMFCFGVVPSLAQTSFAPPGAEWYHHTIEGAFHCFNAGDTIILGKNCTSIRQKAIVPASAWTTDEPTLYTYVSGDTVYIFNRRLSRFTPLYIFNVNEGDTVRIPSFYSREITAEDSIFSFIVDSVRMVLYDTAYLKTVFTSVLMIDSPYIGGGIYSTYRGAYAEKIGSVLNGIYPLCLGCAIPLGGVIYDVGRVRCYNDPAMSIKLVSESCDNSTAETKSIYSEKAFAVFPNPANDLINITSATNSTVVLLTKEGKEVVKARTANGMSAIDVSSFPAGVYLLRVSDETNATQYTPVQIVH